MQYSPPRYRQNLCLLCLTSVARRGRPVGRATESSFAQRGGAARPSTTPHNSETQAPIFSGCLYSNSLRSGPKARKAGQQNQGMCAGREAGFFEGRPLGTGAEAPEIFWVLLYLYKSTSPGGEISQSPVPPADDNLIQTKIYPCLLMITVSRSPVDRSMYWTNRDTLLSSFRLVHSSLASVVASGAVMATFRGSPSKEGRGSRFS